MMELPPAVIKWFLERFSNYGRETITKVITPTNHNRSKQRDEPIRILNKYF